MTNIASNKRSSSSRQHYSKGARQRRSPLRSRCLVAVCIIGAAAFQIFLLNEGKIQWLIEFVDTPATAREEDIRQESPAEWTNNTQKRPSSSSAPPSLQCSDHGGPNSVEAATREMVYWSDNAGDDDYESPFLQEYRRYSDRYVTFEPVSGAWNNVRVAYALATNRILVLPPITKPSPILKISNILAFATTTTTIWMAFLA